MDFLISLAEYSLLAFAALLLLAQLLAHEVGYRFGARNKERATGQTENVGIVVAGMMGLLAFVLALTLSYSNARFSERRQGTLAESNAIGTAWLRANAIGSPDSIEIAKLLEEYAKVREDFVLTGRDPEALAKANADTSALQQTIWQHVTTIVREHPDPISASLMAAVNDTFDTSTSERFATVMRLPAQIFWLLLGVMLLSMAALGYQFGLRGKPVRVMIVVLMIVWTTIIVSILDLAAARVGNFRTDARVYEWTRQGFKGTTNP
ncbi:sterol desaturase/sphingolipid hydroxylase (fatty acid hydroxylase superfamily) [Pararhizobium capsulatum DSM 1112]|uniref:Sterol desaturase/sphingolipid hydroxylase (Fatty acid hydroxylase superfamily) n=1 Tax=Pararhizobium capsulatum DSM 1112 TaxID=1121113 RepID=A0ABU0BPV5_9HYPH|nr:hypothetical protein [Pararhizobium capsulatum]MDQ0319779.1 sterol desaturase/sphingolipid hydroxylase (fatty acid hydroxylase superfamily) [Pararhizobium capsulatum DSM 1112]